MDVVRFDGVCKTFGDKLALDSVSFAIPEGGLFGFLGGNGAGKTTSLRLMLNILMPSAGRVEVLGATPSRQTNRSIGYLPEERGLYQSMTVLDNLVFFAGLRGHRGLSVRRDSMALLDRMGLASVAGQKLKALSKGNAQKVQVATAILTKPRLLLLDEPFSGLDPVAQADLEAILQSLARDGSTVLFSTHVMPHAERLCERLLLLSRGRVIFAGTMHEALAQSSGTLSVVSRLQPPILPGVTAVVAAAEPPEDGWQRWDVTLAPGSEGDSLIPAYLAAGIRLRSFAPQRPSLHDVFVRLMHADQEARS